MATWELGTTPPPITTLASGDRRHQHDPLPPPPPTGLYTRRVTLPSPSPRAYSGPTNSSVLSQQWLTTGREILVPLNFVFVHPVHIFYQLS
jgi:hypothetical protein